MNIRSARLDDASAIAAIHNPIIQDTAITFNSEVKTPDMVADAIRNCPCYLVAEDRGNILGFASYVQFRQGVGYRRAMEHTIILSPASRGRGVGRALMHAIEERARGQDIGSLWAGVSGENPDGVRFHARLGFEEVAVLPKVGYKFGRWMDLVLMRKWLRED